MVTGVGTTDEAVVFATSDAPTAWTAGDLATLMRDPANTIPAFALDSSARVPGFDLWDMWPVEHEDGRLPRFDGAALWMVLAATVEPDPDSRHMVARIYLASERHGRWTLHQPVFPEGFTPGDREWSGSAVLDDTGTRLTVHFTAAGRRNVPGPSLEQRLFEASCSFAASDGGFILSDWSAPQETVVADGIDYQVANQTEGRGGEILGFRDPGYFRDAATGRAYLFFTGSCARSSSRWTGNIGVAQRDDAGGAWRMLPPVLSAAGVNNELERPHMRQRGGTYYLFWSTQAKVFAEGIVAPTGLYGAVAPSPLGPFTLLNGTGLVAGTPPECPAQEYSWWVLDDLQVIGFADFPGIRDMGLIVDAAQRRAHFAGYPAPFFRIALDGATARVVG